MNVLIILLLDPISISRRLKANKFRMSFPPWLYRITKYRKNEPFQYSSEPEIAIFPKLDKALSHLKGKSKNFAQNVTVNGNCRSIRLEQCYSHKGLHSKAGMRQAQIDRNLTSWTNWHLVARVLSRLIMEASNMVLKILFRKLTASKA